MVGLHAKSFKRLVKPSPQWCARCAKHVSDPLLYDKHDVYYHQNSFGGIQTGTKKTGTQMHSFEQLTIGKQSPKYQNTAIWKSSLLLLLGVCRGTQACTRTCTQTPAFEQLTGYPMLFQTPLCVIVKKDK